VIEHRTKLFLIKGQTDSINNKGKNLYLHFVFFPTESYDICNLCSQLFCFYDLF